MLNLVNIHAQGQLFGGGERLADEVYQNKGLQQSLDFLVLSFVII